MPKFDQETQKKLMTFQKEMQDCAYEEMQALAQDITAYEGYQQEKAEKNAEKKFGQQAQDHTFARIAAEAQQKFAKEKLAMKKQLYDFRQHLVDEMMEEIAADLLNFAKTPAYDVWLEKQAKAAQTTEPVSVFLKKGEEGKADLLKAYFPEGKFAAGDIRLGGFLLVWQNGTVLDQTMDAALVEEKERFQRESGFLIA